MPLSPLEKLLALTEVDTDVFCNSKEAISRDIGRKSVFGGTFVAQSLAAALRTVPDDFRPFSLGCNFLVGGRHGAPLYYKVRRTRDGKNYLTRQVEVTQNAKTVFICTISFQAKTLRGSSADLGPQLHYEPPAPRVLPRPEEMVDSAEGLAEWMSLKHVRPHVRNMEEVVLDSDLDPCSWRLPPDFFHGETATFTERNIPAEHRSIKMWFRAKPAIQDPKFHDVALAYCSDAYFLSATSRLNFRNFASFTFSVSLDHTIYFHREFRADEWLLYVVHNPTTGGNKSLVTGRIFDQKGQLVATVFQQGLAIVDDKNAFGQLARAGSDSKL